MAWFSSEIGATDVVSSLEDLTDVNIENKSGGDIVSYDATEGEWVNQPKSLYPSAPTLTYAQYQALVDNDEDDPDAEYYIDDIDVAEAYYVETSGQTALTGATSLTFTNSHITPTSDIRILAEPASCKVATNPQYKVSAKISSCGTGTATITFPALAENTTFWLLIECPLAVTVDPEYVYNTDETVIGQWIDGKPIYRKCFSIPISSMTTVATYQKTYNHGLSIDTLIDFKGSFKVNNTNQGIVNPTVPYTDNEIAYTTGASLNISPTFISLNMGSLSQSRITDVIAIIEYTKTS